MVVVAAVVVVAVAVEVRCAIYSHVIRHSGRALAARGMLHHSLLPPADPPAKPGVEKGFLLDRPNFAPRAACNFVSK